MEGAGAGSRITRIESKDSHVDDLTIIATRVRNLVGRARMVLAAAADDELLIAGADLLAELGEDGAVDGVFVLVVFGGVARASEVELGEFVAGGGEL